MPQRIRKDVARQIVEAVRDVSGTDVNFIDTGGIIFASTDSGRVGDFHEIGLQVVKTGEAIEVTEDQTYLGTHPGVNLPFSYRGEIIGAIGITGDPEEVRKYAYLALRITGLILREQELDERRGSEREELNYVIRSLISGQGISMSYLENFLSRFQLKPDTRCRTVIFQVWADRNGGKLSQRDIAVRAAFEKTGSRFYTFIYPGDYVLILEEERYEKYRSVFTRLAEEYSNIYIGVGSVDEVMDQNKSCEAARIALKSLVEGQNMAVFDDLDLDILLGTVPESACRRYLEKTVSGFETGDADLLKLYFAKNRSLKDTAGATLMHKNTVQYHLDRITDRTGLNPRIFTDGVILYLALKIMDRQ